MLFRSLLHWGFSIVYTIPLQFWVFRKFNWLNFCHLFRNLQWRLLLPSRFFISKWISLCCWVCSLYFHFNYFSRFGLGLNTNNSCSGEWYSYFKFFYFNSSSIGYYCIAGSTSATSSICPPGVYGNTTGLSSSACSGPCLSGYYGNETGLTLSTCSGLCGELGFYCPLNSIRFD